MAVAEDPNQKILEGQEVFEEKMLHSVSYTVEELMELEEIAQDSLYTLSLKDHEVRLWNQMK